MHRKTKLIDGSEQDMVHARRIYCYLANNSKNVKFLKRKINKRERRIGKREASEDA